MLDIMLVTVIFGGSLIALELEKNKRGDRGVVAVIMGMVVAVLLAAEYFFLS